MATRQIAAMLDKLMGSDRNNPGIGAEETGDTTEGGSIQVSPKANEDSHVDRPVEGPGDEANFLHPGQMPAVESPEQGPGSPVPAAKKQMVNWDHPDVCSHHLVQLCPKTLFEDTQSQLGPCLKRHDDRLREKFRQEADEETKKKFEDSFLRFCDEIFDSLSGRMKRGKERIELYKIEKQSASRVCPKEKEQIEKAIAGLTTRINALVDEAQKSCEEGDIVEAKEHLKLCEQLKVEREKQKILLGFGVKQTDDGEESKMELCELCGSVIVVGPKEGREARREAHEQGKEHRGYVLIREAVQDLLNLE